MKKYYFAIAILLAAWCTSPTRQDHTQAIQEEIKNHNVLLGSTIGRIAGEFLTYEDYLFFSVTRYDQNTIVSVGLFGKVLVHPVETPRS